MATPALPLTEQLSMLMSRMQAQGSKLASDWQQREQKQAQQAKPFFQAMQKPGRAGGIDVLSRQFPQQVRSGEIPWGFAWSPETRFMWMMAVNDVRPTFDALEDLRTLRDVMRAGPFGEIRATQLSRDPRVSDWLKTILPEAMAHPDRATAMEDILESLEHYQTRWSERMKDYWDALSAPEMWDALKSDLYQGAKPGGWERAGEMGLEQSLRDLRNVRFVLNYPKPDLLAREVSQATNASEWLKNALPEILAHPNRAGIAGDVQRLIEMYEQYLGKQSGAMWINRLP